MKLQRNNFFKRVFAIAFFFAVIGALLKINHVDDAGIFLAVGIISTFVYVAVGIYEVNKSNKIGSAEKAMWTIGFVVFSFFVGIYYFMKRDRIV